MSAVQKWGENPVGEDLPYYYMYLYLTDGFVMRQLQAKAFLGALVVMVLMDMRRIFKGSRQFQFTVHVPIVIPLIIEAFVSSNFTSKNKEKSYNKSEPLSSPDKGDWFSPENRFLHN